jgi:acyl-CoA thioesterase FadM
LDGVAPALTLEEVRALNIEARDIRVIEEKDCDSSGLYNVNSFQDLVWGSEGISEDNDWLRDLENGDKMGWATMESRCTLIQLPRAGVRVQSFRAAIDVNRKAQHERFWVFDIDDGTLLCTASFVDVAFNINTRRAIEIPEFERKRIDEHLHPELA